MVSRRVNRLLAGIDIQSPRRREQRYRLLVDVDADSDLRMLARVRWLGAIAILNNGSRSR